ncbi:MAG: Gfo/Idh/MocA family oxidoreductase, partial [Planctomycetes bacterium]|nr:Gfo/Idh/MocA family oxidoreductase [Planctomycetota bacterium]
MTMDINRRDVLRMGSALGVGFAFNSLAATNSYAGLFAKKKNAMLFKSKPMDKVRIGFVGVGGRGSGLVRILLDIEGVEMRAICDLKKDRVERAQRWVEEKGQKKPEGYYKGPEDYKNLCQQDDLDLIITATPWELHTPVCVEAMKAGKHASTEVPAAVTVEECWQLVETSEKTGKHCMMMENVCYGREELMALNMARLGIFGELLHGEGAYIHDLRGQMRSVERGTGFWRTLHHIGRNGNLYPTHGLGPIAQYMNINRGDRFD